MTIPRHVESTRYNCEGTLSVFIGQVKKQIPFLEVCVSANWCLRVGQKVCYWSNEQQALLARCLSSVTIGPTTNRSVSTRAVLVQAAWQVLFQLEKNNQRGISTVLYQAALNAFQLLYLRPEIFLTLSAFFKTCWLISRISTIIPLFMFWKLLEPLFKT